MNNLITTIMFCVALSLPLIVNAEKIDKTLDVSANGRINIEIMAGEIVVEGWDKPQVRVVGDLPANGHNFTFETNGSVTEIEHQGEHGFWGSNRGPGGHANITVYAPRDSRFSVDSTSAEYSLKNINGQVRASTMSGDIYLEGGVGNVTAESVSGNVKVTGSKGRLYLGSVSGNINADGNAEEFDAQTISGNIHARVGTSSRITLESISGDIDLKARLGDNARLDAGTVSGDIEIVFDSEDINASFDIETGPGGEVRNRISDHKPENERFLFSGTMRFKLGDGDSSVNLETMSGTIKMDH